LAVEPSFIVLDEPTSSLDVSVQAQVLCLLKDLQQRFGLAYLFISHDLEVVTSMSQQLAVMYLGRFVEVGEADVVLGEPTHPYTRLLLSTTSLPRAVLEEQPGALSAEHADRPGPPSGCPFVPRCPARMPQCDVLTPHLRSVREGHSVACHRV
jgi:peptide/nickel transport system ATP-binding protein